MVVDSDTGEPSPQNQTIRTEDGPTVITWHRKLWDRGGNFNIESNRFKFEVDGVFFVNGKIAVTPNENVTAIYLILYRNGEEYWYCATRTAPIPNKETLLSIADDIDGYVTSGHYFDLRVVVEGEGGAVEINGVDVKTAWGMSFVTELEGESPT